MAISKRSKVKYPFVKDTLGLWFQASLNRCRDRSFGSVEWHLLMMNVSTVVLVVIVACRAVTIPLPVPSPDEKMGGRFDIKTKTTIKHNTVCGYNGMVWYGMA